jgi:hypothetical protein
MPAHRMNMRMIKDVLRLKFDGGFSHDRIAASLGISKGVVTKYVGLAGAAGLDWASACDMDEGELERRLLGKPTGPAAYAQPDYGRIHQELRRKGVTLTLLWEEYQAEFADRQTYRYTQFADCYVLALLSGLPCFVRRLLFRLTLSWIDAFVYKRPETSRSLLRLIDGPTSWIANGDPHCRAVYLSLKDVCLGAASRRAQAQSRGLAIPKERLRLAFGAAMPVYASCSEIDLRHPTTSSLGPRFRVTAV